MRLRRTYRHGPNARLRGPELDRALERIRLELAADAWRRRIRQLAESDATNDIPMEDRNHEHRP